MKKSLLAMSTLAALSLAPLATANDFQVEVRGSYSMADAGPADIKTFGVDGTYYIERVSTRSGPLEEVGYLSKSSFIQAGFFSVGGDGDDDIIGFGGRFVLDDSLFFGGDYVTSDAIDTLSIEGGTYLGDNSSVHATLARSEADLGIADVETDAISVTYKTVMEQGNGTAFGLEGTVTHLRPDGGKNINSLDVDAKYFLTTATHVGALFGYTPTSDAKSKSYGVEVQSFVDPMIAIGASFERDDPDAGAETDTISLWVKGRF